MSDKEVLPTCQFPFSIYHLFVRTPQTILPYVCGPLIAAVFTFFFNHQAYLHIFRSHYAGHACKHFIS